MILSCKVWKAVKQWAVETECIYVSIDSNIYDMTIYIVIDWLE